MFIILLHICDKSKKNREENGKESGNISLGRAGPAVYPYCQLCCI
jgi:hypothetical protein